MFNFRKKQISETNIWKGNFFQSATKCIKQKEQITLNTKQLRQIPLNNINNGICFIKFQESRNYRKTL